MKKLFVSLASVAMLAGMGAAYAGPTTLDAATLDGITAAGSHQRKNSGRNGGDRTFQNNQNLVVVQSNIGGNIALLSGRQETNQSNFNGNISD